MKFLDSAARLVCTSPDSRASGDRATLALNLVVGVVIVVFAGLFRVKMLTSQSLWLDDAWVALVSRMSFEQVCQIGMTSFGFNTILWAWFQIVGFSEVLAKLIPFIAGCLGPVAVYVLALRKGLPVLAGISGALILVVAPMHISYSGAVKQYTLEALLTVVLVWLAWNVLEEPRRKKFIALGAAACFSIYVSSMLVFVVVPTVCIPAAWTALKRKEFRVDCVLLAAVPLGFAGVWIPLMSQYSNPLTVRFFSAWYVVRDEGLRGMAESTVGLVKLFFSGMTKRSFIFASFGAVAATVLAARRRPLLTGMLWCPIVLVYLAAFAGRAPLGAGRTDIFLYPLMALVAALAVDEMFRLFATLWSAKPWQESVSLMAGVAVIFLIVRGARPGFMNWNYREEDLRPLAALVMNQKREGDKIVVYPWARWQWFLYSGQPFTIPSRKERPRGEPYTMDAVDTITLDEYPEDPEAYAADLGRAIGANRIWLVATHLGYMKHEVAEIREHIRHSGYRLERKDERTGAFVELWVRSDKDQ